MSTLLLTRSQVESLLDMKEVIEAIEGAFKALAEGKAIMPPKTYVILEKGDFRAMPSVLPGAIGLKWVNVHPDNKSGGLPTVMAMMIYNDPQTLPASGDGRHRYNILSHRGSSGGGF